jgi:hypothetical protein
MNTADGAKFFIKGGVFENGFGGWYNYRWWN